MSKLDELIEKLCPNGVEYKKLQELCNTITTGKLNANAMNEDGKYPFFTCDSKPSKINEYAFDEEAILISGNGSQVGHINYYKGKFNAYQRTYILYDFNKIKVKYLLHYLGAYLKGYILINSKKGSVPYITLPILQNFKVPVPPIEVQNEIVRILDSFTELEAEVEAEVEARNKQYEFYKNKLLTLNKSTYYSLGELCDIVDYRGKTPKKVNNGIFLVTAKNIKSGYIDYNISKEYINTTDYDDVMHRGKVKIGDVLITTEAPCGNVALVDREDIALAQRVIKYRPKDNRIISSFLKHILMGKEFQDKLYKNATGGTVKGIKGKILHKLTIPVPSLETQERISSILDRFDKLCNDISEGLPAEIEARRKQYEYYRDKLLSFKELKVENKE